MTPSTTIMKNVPVPAPKRKPPPVRRKWPLLDMDVDDMFFVPGRTKNNLATYCSTAGTKLGRKFITRLCWMKGSDEKGWTIAEPNEKGAVQGIGVWRVA